jgi:hypothetical protein
VNWRANIFGSGYWVAKTSLGFLLHPYQTMPQLFSLSRPASHPLAFFLVLTPTIYYLLAVFCWRLFLRDLIALFLVANCPLMIIKTSVVFFTLYWQLSLLY